MEAHIGVPPDIRLRKRVGNHRDWAALRTSRFYIRNIKCPQPFVAIKGTTGSDNAGGDNGDHLHRFVFFYM
jgi:hypothetical protein